jgi:hypothetical protein
MRSWQQLSITLCDAKTGGIAWLYNKKTTAKSIRRKCVADFGNVTGPDLDNGTVSWYISAPKQLAPGVTQVREPRF